MVDQPDYSRTYSSIEKSENIIPTVKEFLEKNPDEFLYQIGLFTNRQILARFLFFKEMYSHIKNIHGNVAEFGTRWGQNIIWMENLRGLIEPYNHNRRFLAFDTFSGFPGTDNKDGTSKLIGKGGYGMGWENYDLVLERLLKHHENQSPISHIKKFKIIKGDVNETLPLYIDKNPHTIFALAYFDMDLYKPTLESLKIIIKRMPKGGVIGFDELNHENFPGETEAFLEIFGGNLPKLYRSEFSPHTSYIIIE